MRKVKQQHQPVKQAMHLHSPNTELNGRVLWYDGDSTVNPDKIIELLSTGMPIKGICVKELTEEIEQYNKLVGPDEWIKTKVDIRDLDFEWNIPQEYKSIDIESHIVNSYHCINNELMSKEQTDRIAEELELYERLGLMDVLRVLIYVINTLQTHNIVWGVGRGSSVASYILYLIGVHDIDSIKYELNITDFLRVDES